MAKENKIISMNFEGFFSKCNMKKCNQKIIEEILIKNDVVLFFGQGSSLNFDLPEKYDSIGNDSTFICYDQTVFSAVSYKGYKKHINELERNGKLPKIYLANRNYTITKMTQLNDRTVQFITVSWITDKQMKSLSSSVFGGLCTFLNHLSQVEGLPVLLSGSFFLDAAKANKISPNNFKCYGYQLNNRKRYLRFSNIFVQSGKLMDMKDVKPLNVGKISFEHNSSKSVKLSLDDAFNFDPIICKLGFQETEDLVDGLEISTVHLASRRRYFSESTQFPKVYIQQSTMSAIGRPADQGNLPCPLFGRSLSLFDLRKASDGVDSYQFPASFTKQWETIFHGAVKKVAAIRPNGPLNFEHLTVNNVMLEGQLSPYSQADLMNENKSMLYKKTSRIYGSNQDLYETLNTSFSIPSFLEEYAPSMDRENTRQLIESSRNNKSNGIKEKLAGLSKSFRNLCGINH